MGPGPIHGLGSKSCFITLYINKQTQSCPDPQLCELCQTRGQQSHTEGHQKLLEAPATLHTLKFPFCSTKAEIAVSEGDLGAFNTKDSTP